MKRREFISIFAGASVWSAFAFAQQSRRPVRIGLIPLGSADNRNDLALVDAFLDGLRDVALIRGLNVEVDVAWVKNEADFPQTIKDLIDRGAAILVPAGTSASVAAKNQTTTVPIVFLAVGDPVGVGLANSLDRPGGNITGFSDVLLDVSSKIVGLAQDVSRPNTNSVDYLWYANWANGRQRFEATEQAARKAGLQLRSYTISDIGTMSGIFASMKKDGAVVAIIQPGPFTYRHRSDLIAAATQQGVGTIFAWPDAAREGALIGYGPDYADIYRRAGSYIERILNGAKPSELPVQQPVKFQLVLNIKTASAVGVSIAPHLLISADEVVE
jgi:putative ABC transport system substrate-binding protein